ncbi:Uncharacterized protein Adt_17660 [Abeliophyllum distichum]|uniref:Uncharacterized protein n=1 Tax=Abeliophyllum distichum TaxID=126358 RepID=A0ABD1THX5_9LAMI
MSSVSPSVSSSMENVLPIRGIDGNTGEALPIGPAPGLREGTDPYRMEVVRWAALDLPSILVEEDLTKMREQYRIPSDVELILPGPNERACFPREGCTALHLNAFVSGMRLPLHPMLRRILRAYALAPTQPRKLPRKKGKEEEAGWYYFCPWGSHKPLVTGCPSSIKQWKESWFWVWQLAEGGRRPGAGLGCSKCLRNSQLSSSVRAFEWEHRRASVNLSGGYAEPKLQLHSEPTALPGELGLIASQAGAGNKGAAESPKVIEVDDAPEAEVPLSRKRKARPSGSGTSQAAATVVEVANLPTTTSVPPLQRTLTVNVAGEVVLEGPPKATPTPEGETGGAYDSRKRLRELIGAPGASIPDDALRSVPFFPSMGAQAFKKYFTSKMGGVLFPWRAGRCAGGPAWPQQYEPLPCR